MSYNLNLKLRDYQHDIVKQALSFGRGIIKVGTGGGKTLTIASILSSIYKNNILFGRLFEPDKFYLHVQLLESIFAYLL